MQIFTEHEYEANLLSRDKGANFTSQLFLDLVQASGIKMDLAIRTHAQTIGMIERTHQKLKPILEINVIAGTTQWDRYINIVVVAQKPTYHQFIKCTPTESFHGRVPRNALDLEFSSLPKTPCIKTDLHTLAVEVNQEYKENFSNLFDAFH